MIDQDRAARPTPRSWPSLLQQARAINAALGGTEAPGVAERLKG